MSSPRRLARGAVALALAAMPIATASQSTGAAGGEAPVRLHHVHYRVADPAQAMTTVARAVDGVRVVVQGFGVGVRTGSELILFDRAAEAMPQAPGRPIVDVYPVVLARLRQWGMSAQPETANQLHSAAALPHEIVDHVGFSVPDVRAARDRAIDGGARVVSERDDAVLIDAGAGLLIELLRDTDREETFWCPMHPDIRSADAAKCPLCGMDMVPIPPPRIGEYHLDVDVDRVKTGVIRGFRFAVREPGSDALVRELLPVHEATLHLFVVSRDLTFFDHVHPERMSDGTYRLQRELPAGEYMLIADFLPAGGTTQMVQRAVTSGRPPAAGNSPSSETDFARTRTVGGLTVTLEAGAGSAGKELPLTFRLADASTGAPVTDLQPYLGAPAHMLVVRADLSDAIHAHPEEVVATGPTVTFHPLLPSVGEYRLWIQFKRNGRVLTFPFAVRAGQ